LVNGCALATRANQTLATIWKKAMNETELIERLAAELKEGLLVFIALEKTYPGEFAERITRIRAHLFS
jgi:hypothetical protein